MCEILFKLALQMFKILLLVQVCGPMDVSGVLELQELTQDLVIKWGEANIHRQKYSQISTGKNDDLPNCRKQMCQNSKTLIKISRFNSVTGESERPSSLGPGFTAPPGGPEYLNRKVSNDEFCGIIESLGDRMNRFNNI